MVLANASASAIGGFILSKELTRSPSSAWAPLKIRFSARSVDERTLRRYWGY